MVVATTTRKPPGMSPVLLDLVTITRGLFRSRDIVSAQLPPAISPGFPGA
jgi:hypothetical protein